MIHVFSSVAQSCLTLCDRMNCSTPGLPVHHQLPKFTQTHVHRVSDAIQPSHPVVPFSSCPQSLPASVFSSESTLRMRWPKYVYIYLEEFNVKLLITKCVTHSNLYVLIKLTNYNEESQKCQENILKSFSRICFYIKRYSVVIFLFSQSAYTVKKDIMYRTPQQEIRQKFQLKS